MNCEQCKQWQIPYLENELAPHEQVKIKAHLQQCTSCTDEFSAMSSLWQALDNQVEHQPRPQLHSRFQSMLAQAVNTRTHKEKTSRSNPLLSWLWSSKPTWIASYSFFLLFSGVMLGHHFPQYLLLPSQSENVSAQFDFSNISQDRLVQICAVQDSQLYETL